MDMLVIQTLVLLFVFLFGIAIGSFLNVVIYRYQTGAKVGNDRSRCMSCGKTLAPHMLIPLLSFFLQKGRCAYCQTKLSWQYPVTEFLGGALAVGIVMRSGLDILDWSPMRFAECGSALTFFFVLLVITVYDWKHKIIPDRFSLTLSCVALLHVAILVSSGEKHLLPTILTGLGIASPFALLWLVSKGRWMGLGDAKLAVGLGLFLGYPIGVSIPILAFWVGTIPAIALLLFRSGITMKSEIPFGPSLALSTYILYVTPIDILQLKAIWPNIIG